MGTGIQRMAFDSTQQPTRSSGKDEDTAFSGGYSSSYMSTRNICRLLDLQRDDQRWMARCSGNVGPPFCHRKCNTLEYNKKC